MPKEWTSTSGPQSFQGHFRVALIVNRRSALGIKPRITKSLLGCFVAKSHNGMNQTHAVRIRVNDLLRDEASDGARRRRVASASDYRLRQFPLSCAGRAGNWL